MIISKQTENFVGDVGAFAKKEFNHPNDVATLAEISLQPEFRETFSAIAFTAKYLIGLNKVLAKRAINNDAYMQRMFEEYKNTIVKLSDQLKSFVLHHDMNLAKEFDEKYFDMNQDCIANLMRLAEDLASFKEYTNAHPDL